MHSGCCGCDFYNSVPLNYLSHIIYINCRVGLKLKLRAAQTICSVLAGVVVVVALVSELHLV